MPEGNGTALATYVINIDIAFEYIHDVANVRKIWIYTLDCVWLFHDPCFKIMVVSLCGNEGHKANFDQICFKILLSHRYYYLTTKKIINGFAITDSVTVETPF